MTIVDVLGLRWQYARPDIMCRGGSPAIGQTQGYAQAGQQQGEADETLTNAAGNLSSLNGPNPGSTPYYKALLTSGTQATADAYKNAQSNLLAKSRNAGFGYTQPATTGAQSELGG